MKPYFLHYFFSPIFYLFDFSGYYLVYVGADKMLYLIKYMFIELA